MNQGSFSHNVKIVDGVVSDYESRVIFPQRQICLLLNLTDHICWGYLELKVLSAILKGLLKAAFL